MGAEQSFSRTSMLWSSNTGVEGTFGWDATADLEWDASFGREGRHDCAAMVYDFYNHCPRFLHDAQG